MTEPSTNDHIAAAERLAVSPAEAARLAGIGRTTIYEALGSRALPSLKIGKRRLILIVPSERGYGTALDASTRAHAADVSNVDACEGKVRTRASRMTKRFAIVQQTKKSHVRRGRMKRVDPRRVKIHRSYTVEEVARLFTKSTRTQCGIGRSRPASRRPSPADPHPGRQARGYLHARRRLNRQRCATGELYLLQVQKAPGAPLAGTAEYLPSRDRIGQSTGVCAHCGTRMYRRVSLRSWRQWQRI